MQEQSVLSEFLVHRNHGFTSLFNSLSLSASASHIIPSKQSNEQTATSISKVIEHTRSSAQGSKSNQSYFFQCPLSSGIITWNEKVLTMFYYSIMESAVKIMVSWFWQNNLRKLDEA